MWERGGSSSQDKLHEYVQPRFVRKNYTNGHNKMKLLYPNVAQRVLKVPLVQPGLSVETALTEQQ